MTTIGLERSYNRQKDDDVERYRPKSPAEIIHLKKRNFIMLKKDLILRNPLRLLGQEDQYILPEGGIGAVLARAGVGKTALMVQLALDTLLRGKNVLHVSLDDPVEKVSLWHKEVFQNMAAQYNLTQINQLWDAILPKRFIMTFKVEGFSVPKLEERLRDLTEQNIFTPQMIIVDGFPFDEASPEPLQQLRDFSSTHGLRIWFSVKTHRHEKPGLNGIPPQLSNIDDLFNVILQLQPEGKNVHVKVLRGAEEKDYPELLLDPATMLISRNE
jgi:hypothetical protein